MTELNLPSRTSRPTLPSATPSREGNRDHVKEPRPRNGSGNFGGSVDRSDHSRGKAGANGGSTKEGKWEKAAIVEGKNANAAKNTRPIANATKDSKAQDKKQSHMDQMKEFEEMRLKLRAERENKGACSGTPANGGTFHKETDGLMAEMIEASDQTPLKATETTSDSVVGNVIEQQQPVDNDVMGSLTGAMMDSLFAQPVPAPASEMNTESRSSRLFSWSAAAATPTPPNIPLVSSLTSSASNSSPSLNDLNIDSLLSASPAPVSLEPLTGGIGSLDLAGALDSLVHEEPVAPVNSVSNEFASLLLGHSNVPSQVEPVSTSSPPPKPVTSKTSQQRLQPSQQQSLRIQQLQKHQLNMQHQLQQSKASDSLNPPVSGMPIHTSAPITILQKLQVNPQSVNEAPVAPVSQVLSTSSPKRESAPVSPVSNPPHSTQNKSTVNLLSRLGIAPKSVAQSQTSVGPVAAATSGIVPMTFAQIQQQELENKTISDTTPVKAAPASTAASPFAFHTANTPVTPTSTSNTGAGSNASSNKLRKFQVLQQQKKLTTTPGKTILPKKTSPTATVQSAPVSSPGVRRVDVQGLFKKN